MKKILIFLMVLMLLMISGCSKQNDVVKHNLVFTGQNEEWTAEMTVKGTTTFIKTDGVLSVERDLEKKLTVTYKKELSDLIGIKHLGISYKSTAGGGNIEEDYDKEMPLDRKQFVLNSGGKNGAIENEDETIFVKININGVMQTIELKNEK